MPVTQNHTLEELREEASRHERIRWRGVVLTSVPMVLCFIMIGMLIGSMAAGRTWGPMASNSPTPFYFNVFLGVAFASFFSLPIAAVGAGVWAFGAVRLWRLCRRVDFRHLPLVPLVAGERIGAWLVLTADESELRLIRRPTSRPAWIVLRWVFRTLAGLNISMVVIPLALGRLSGSDILCGLLAIGWAGSCWLFFSDRELAVDKTGVTYKLWLDWGLPPVTRRWPSVAIGVRTTRSSEPEMALRGINGGVNVKWLGYRNIALWNANRIATEIEWRQEMSSDNV